VDGPPRSNTFWKAPTDAAAEFAPHVLGGLCTLRRRVSKRTRRSPRRDQLALRTAMGLTCSEFHKLQEVSPGGRE